MSLIVQHIPHIIPAVLALGFLLRFAMHARRMPPADLTDEQLEDWQRQQGRRRPWRRSAAADPAPPTATQRGR